MKTLILVVLALTFAQVAYAREVDYSTTTIKRAVIERFGTTSPMVAVAFCESGFRQFDSHGEVLRGREVSDDRGLFQINLRYHGVTSLLLGYDVGTLEGNIGYAEYLYEKQGLSPWSASSSCLKNILMRE